MRLGIMGAMQEEVSQILSHVSEIEREARGMREYVSGQLQGKSVTVAFSRCGKVAASSTATTLIERFGVDFLVFTGVAGAVDRTLNVGDIVVADTLIQHDMDVSALGLERFEVPLLGVSHFDVEQRLVGAALRAAETYLARNLSDDVGADALAEFHIIDPQVTKGTIASGDQFVTDDRTTQALRDHLPGLKCVEMEGAAVAQVAYEYGIPCVVLRTISDKADHSATVDFPRFVARAASHFTCGSVLRLLDELDSIAD